MGSAADRYVVISADSHDEPPIHTEEFLPYLDKEYRADLEGYLKSLEGLIRRNSAAIPESSLKPLVEDRWGNAVANLFVAMGNDEEWVKQAVVHIRDEPGLTDPKQRLADNEAHGIVAEVVMPSHTGYLKFLADSDNPGLVSAGLTAYTRWMADYCSAGAGRLAGYIPIEGTWSCTPKQGNDLPASIENIHWGRDHGIFGGVMLPTPGNDLPALVDPYWEPLWSVCEDLELPLIAHLGAHSATPDVQAQYGTNPFVAGILGFTEIGFFSKRTFFHLMAAGVFDRHPRLKFVLTEQTVGSLAGMIHELDQGFLTAFVSGPRSQLKMIPSEYWMQHGFICSPFMDGHDARNLYQSEIGIDTLMWGSDYPHVEGTWPNVEVGMQYALGGLPDEAVRSVLGRTAAKALNFDYAALQNIADTLGPTVESLSTPLPEADIPRHSLSWNYRVGGEPVKQLVVT